MDSAERQLDTNSYDSHDISQIAAEFEPDLHKALVAKGEIAKEEVAQAQVAGIAKETSDEVAQVEYTEVEAALTKMLTAMEEQIAALNGDEELVAKGFGYPVHFFEAFKKGILEAIERKEVPDIGIIGYGSLGSVKSTAESVKGGYQRALVRTTGLQRGLYSSYFSTRPSREDAFWGREGSSKSNESMEMAVKYKEGQPMNGVRLSGLSTADLMALERREFSYFMLPVDTAVAKDGKKFDFNLVCWPMDRKLMEKLRRPEIEQYLSHPLLKREPGQYPDDKFFDANVGALFPAGARPDIKYLETCADIGDSEEERMFLETTFVVMEDGSEMTAKEWLDNHAPGNDPDKREYFGQRWKKGVTYPYRKDGRLLPEGAPDDSDVLPEGKSFDLEKPLKWRDMMKGTDDSQD